METAEDLTKTTILNCIDNNKPFPNELQIKILKTIIEKHSDFQSISSTHGICHFILDQIVYLTKKGFDRRLFLNVYFPLLNPENATKVTSKVCINGLNYWWYKNEEGNANRIKFINWIIQKLEKE